MQGMYYNSIIIGNGFDLSLGLPTRYSDFIASEFFRRHLEDKKPLFRNLHILNERNRESKWVDIEEELFNIATDLHQANPLLKYIDEFVSVSDLRAQYEILRSQLSSYINSLNEHSINKESNAAKLIQQIGKSGSQTFIFNFNYTTNHIRSIINESDLFKRTGAPTILSVHGQAKDNSIILGSQDHKKITTATSFLCKSSSQNFGNHQFYEHVTHSSQIHIFGHSLGNSDESYFRFIFSELLTTRNTPGNGRRTISIYYYGEDNYLTLLNQIHTLSNYRLDLIRLYHSIRFIDVKKPDAIKTT